MSKKILIFGGSGFIGSALVERLLSEKNQVCVICTNEKKALSKIGSNKNLEIKSVDIFDEEKLQKLVKNYDVVINLIGKLFEAKKGDFVKFHHHFPKILSKLVSKNQFLIHISALAIEKSAKTSTYAKTKLDGQNSIVKNAAKYCVIKPSIVFGKQDNFFNQFAKMTKISPFLPIIGGGKSKFSPVYVEDLVKAVVAVIGDEEKYKNRIFEAYGPKTASFRQLMSFILKTINKKRLLLELPFFIAKLQAKFLNILKIYLLTSDQVELLKYDNISDNKCDNIDSIIGELKSYEKITPKYLVKK